MVNKYNVCLARTLCIEYEVEAESEEEAIEEAESLCDDVETIIHGCETYTDEANTKVELLEENILEDLK